VLTRLHAAARAQQEKELPRLTDVALTSTSFPDVESAIADIAALGTPAAQRALVAIRSQPERLLYQDVDVYENE